MEAALLARIHYLDLGGLFTWTKRQLRLNGRFKKPGSWRFWEWAVRLELRM